MKIDIKTNMKDNYNSNTILKDISRNKLGIPKNTFGEYVGNILYI